MKSNGSKFPKGATAPGNPAQNWDGSTVQPFTMGYGILASSFSFSASMGRGIDNDNGYRVVSTTPLSPAASAMIGMSGAGAGAEDNDEDEDDNGVVSTLLVVDAAGSVPSIVG